MYSKTKEGWDTEGSLLFREIGVRYGTTVSQNIGPVSARSQFPRIFQFFHDPNLAVERGAIQPSATDSQVPRFWLLRLFPV